MEMQVATYSRSALNECAELVKQTAWTVSTKKEHFSKCFEVEKVFDFCLEKTGCILFEAEYSAWKDYLKDVGPKGTSKKALDADLRRCHRFICNELNEISRMMSSGEVNEVD